ncbi:uncharacterized protein LY79DRAFT_125918 [Colletotrichum navitas]|uniref:Uncharacterized protein n=1 Tax=Colletotrichum navitas TaxID=681940 RepID=A0AAD8Q2N5_9PEZI|nr:uncharacterized protein LY79DRAFT_125918 [Colletotrichum navitas]KAK1594802.1 hypothetical protein LY79DRAFT_125918 [Colletotrichum navitas]
MKLQLLLTFIATVVAAVIQPDFKHNNTAVGYTRHLSVVDTPHGSSQLHQLLARDPHHAYEIAEEAAGPLKNGKYLHFMLCWPPKIPGTSGFGGHGCRHYGLVVGLVNTSEKTYDAVFVHAELKPSPWKQSKHVFTGLRNGQSLRRPGYKDNVDMTQLLTIGQPFIDWMNSHKTIAVDERTSCYKYYQYVLDHM